MPAACSGATIEGALATPGGFVAPVSFDDSSLDLPEVLGKVQAAGASCPTAAGGRKAMAV
jgi:hypothetical protein